MLCSTIHKTVIKSPVYKFLHSRAYLTILMLVHYLQRIRDRLLGPLPGDWHHDPRVQEDGHHLPHRLPRAIRLLLLDAGGDGGRAGDL